MGGAGSFGTGARRPRAASPLAFAGAAYIWIAVLAALLLPSPCRSCRRAGWHTVPLQTVNYNLGEEIGWPDLAKTVAGVYGTLPLRSRRDRHRHRQLRRSRRAAAVRTRPRAPLPSTRARTTSTSGERRRGRHHGHRGRDGRGPGLGRAVLRESRTSGDHRQRRRGRQRGAGPVDLAVPRPRRGRGSRSGPTSSTTTEDGGALKRALVPLAIGCVLVGVVAIVVAIVGWSWSWFALANGALAVLFLVLFRGTAPARTRADRPAGRASPPHGGRTVRADTLAAQEAALEPDADVAAATTVEDVATGSAFLWTAAAPAAAAVLAVVFYV